MTEEEQKYLSCLGELIMTKRKVLHISQEEMAKKVEISRNHVHRIEKGEYPTSIITLRRIAKVLDVPLRELMNI